MSNTEIRSIYLKPALNTPGIEPFNFEPTSQQAKPEYLVQELDAQAKVTISFLLTLTRDYPNLEAVFVARESLDGKIDSKMLSFPLRILGSKKAQQE